MSKKKDIFVFTFSSVQHAYYWMEQTFLKFEEDVIACSKFEMKIEFPEAVYYFTRVENALRIKILHPDFVYPEEVLYCILDDPEFYRSQGVKMKDGR